MAELVGRANAVNDHLIGASLSKLILVRNLELFVVAKRIDGEPCEEDVPCRLEECRNREGAVVLPDLRRPEAREALEA